jgi:hypothetical protein
VAQSTIRFAASASVIVASLMVAGPNPAHAVADKHNSGSHNQNDIRRTASNARGSIGNGGAGNWVNDAFGGNDASIGGGAGDLATAQSVESAAPSTLRSAAVAEQPTGVNASGAVAAPRVGSDYSGPFARALRSPRVVIGNGRSPGDPVAGSWSARETLSDSSLQVSDAPESAPAAPEAVEIDIPPSPPSTPPTEHIRAAVVVGELGIGTIDTATDPLAGVAGLILIPAVGAVLGYRQARAAQSVRESARTSVRT